MEKKQYDHFVAILNKELAVALGCTEPIAIAYAGAKAREVLGMMPIRCSVSCSGNIIKNVKGVIVPNSDGQKGIDVAVALGIIGGDASKELAVLESVTQADRRQAKELLIQDFCTCELIENVENLYIIVRVENKTDSAEVEIKNYHSNITRIVKNGNVLYEKKEEIKETENFPDKSLLNVKDILEFANTVCLSEIEPVIKRQIEYNSAIAEAGIHEAYGAEVGRTLLSDFDRNSVKLRAKAYAAAGSDARMSGCPMPVVINSGSGNQGITVSVPVIQYAKEYQATEEQMYRSLVVSNLISIHQKKYIGSLSAYCGAVSAACGSGAGIAYLSGADYEVICNVITDTIANIGGMVCDGAKPSCAAKIASALDAAIMAVHMARKKRVFQSGEGLVKANVEETIKSIGRMGREGMKHTDIEILNIMLDK